MKFMAESAMPTLRSRFDASVVVDLKAFPLAERVTQRERRSSSQELRLPAYTFGCVLISLNR
jgi:hypothetical protein